MEKLTDYTYFLRNTADSDFVITNSTNDASHKSAVPIVVVGVSTYETLLKVGSVNIVHDT